MQIAANISPERYALLLERAKAEASVTVTSKGASISIDDVRLEAWYTDGTVYVSIYKAPFYVEHGEVQKLFDRWLLEPDKGSSYNEFWDTGFAGEGDPNGIQREYISQSFSPDAARPLPTQEEADAESFRADEEMRQRRESGE